MYKVTQKCTKKITHVGQKPTRACVVLLFKYADYK